MGRTPRIARMSARKSTKANPSNDGAVASAHKREYGLGKQKLLRALARLAAREGSTRLTLRALAAESGMGHNAIYRHFDSVEDMLPTLIGDFTQQLREGLRQARTQVPAHELPSKTVVGWLFDFALSNKDVFVVAMRERHGPSGPARQALDACQAAIVTDMQSDLMALNRLPALPADTMNLALRFIVQQTFELCLVLIESPERREALLLEAGLVFAWCLTGASVVSGQHPASKGD
jgi:TetR/AcrR family transcriptional regulator, fatty acid biosynthesis regulator